MLTTTDVAILALFLLALSFLDGDPTPAAAFAGCRP